MDNLMPGESGGIPMQTTMDGLLGNPFLQIGLGILANNQGHGGRLFPALGLGAQQGLQNVQRQKAFAQQQQMADLQRQQIQMAIDKQKQDQAKEQQVNDIFKGAYQPATEAQNPQWNFMDANNAVLSGQDYNQPQTVNKPASFNIEGLLPQIMAVDPARGMALYQTLQKDNTPIKVGKGETLVNPNSYKPVFTAPEEPKYQFAPNGSIVDLSHPDLTKNYAKPDELPTSVKEFNFGLQNPQYNVWSLGQKRAGATKVSVSTDKGYAGAVAKGLADADIAAIDTGRAAPQRLDNARMIKQVLSQNPITGTGAEARLSINKALSTAGIIDGTQVKSTEDLASLLASSTLDAIKTSGLGAGQGFTDKDRQFLERARSGNIEINAGTLNTLADLNERSALASIKRANTVIVKLKSNPDMGEVGTNLDLIPEPSAAPNVGKAVPLPAKPSTLTLRKGVLYMTPKGQLTWNGKAFEE